MNPSVGRARVLFIAAVLGTATLVGSLLAWARIRAWDTPAHQLDNGPWRAHADTERASDPLTIAQLAVYLLFALKQSEVVYFVTHADAAGAPLRAECTYTVSGKDMDARYWSITVYDKDALLIPNPQKKYSYNKFNVAYDADRRFTYRLGPTAGEAPGSTPGPTPAQWVPTGTDRQGLVLALRLYHPSDGLRANLRTFEAPKVVKESCP